MFFLQFVVLLGYCLVYCFFLLVLYFFFDYIDFVTYSIHNTNGITVDFPFFYINRPCYRLHNGILFTKLLVGHAQPQMGNGTLAKYDNKLPHIHGFISTECSCNTRTCPKLFKRSYAKIRPILFIF